MSVIRFEAAIEGRCVSYAESNGYISRKVQWAGRRGAPDRFFSSPRTGPFFVEFKDPAGALSKLQEMEIGILKAYGTPVFVIRSFDAFVELLEILEGPENPLRGGAA